MIFIFYALLGYSECLIYIFFSMNNSVSTVTGKIKIKIVLLGNQSVGKSSIIDKYANDKFDQTAHVYDE